MRVFELVRADFRSLFRDPTLVAATVAPLLIVAVVLWGYPAVGTFVMGKWEVDIAPYYHIFSLFMTLIIAMVYGIISAFIILDERDESILSFIKVTPFSMKGYVQYRMGFAYVSSLVATLFYALSLALVGEFTLSELLLLALVVPLEAIFQSLFVVAFAGNKVEGLALAKIVGLIPFSAVAAWFIEGAISWLFIIFPPFWIVKTVQSSTPSEWALFCVGAIIAHIIPIMLLAKRFKKKIEC